MAGVYISYPFCSQKCTYCNFASGVFSADLEQRYVHRVVAELRAAEWAFRPETVYLGGGTPSRMDGGALAAILAAVPGAPWAEATIEAAPGGLDAARVRAWRDAGINRVSLGVQSFVARELSRTGRKHTAEIVEKEVASLRAAGIANFNIDLIAGLPGQTEGSWRESLKWIERLDAPHISVYMLEVDDDSRLGAEILAFGKRYGALDVPGDDQIADFYESAVERLAAMGIARYEISNFARPGFESRHNLKYWRREPYLGFGADAHSFDGRWRWQNLESAEEYVERAGSAVVERALADDIGEPYFLGLRLSEGISRVAGPFDAAIERFLRDGLLEEVGGRVRLTSRGVLLSNEVFAEFVGPGFQPAAGLPPGESSSTSTPERRLESRRQTGMPAPRSSRTPGFVEHALVRATSAFLPTHGSFNSRFNGARLVRQLRPRAAGTPRSPGYARYRRCYPIRAKRRHECRRGTHECVLHDFQ